MRHRWDDSGRCKNCGLEREMRTEKLLMAIVNHPPWNSYKYSSRYAYSFDLRKWSFVRPDCKKLNNPPI